MSILGLGNPGGSGFWVGEGPDGQDGGNTRVSLRATQGRGGRIPSQQGGFQVSGKGNKREQGEQGEQGDHCVHNLSILCIYRNECSNE
jgi:hypothetical protein